MTDPSFETLFHVLTGRRPFDWQTRLYRRLVAGDPPKAVDVPTGLGKTATLAVWLLALAAEPRRVPRRLVYVVNRRAVVDQSTREAERLVAALQAGDRGEGSQLAGAVVSLRALSGAKEGPVIAISTLRGQHADNGQWRQDPSRPAIVLGTVDMIGSRLLFSGYGVGPRSRAVHAGLLGQDALLVHDEAHLEPAFQSLVEDIVNRRFGDWESERKLRVIALTATPRKGDQALRIEDTDLKDEIVAQRVRARKALRLVESADLAVDLARQALELAGSDAAVIVFARTLELVEKVVAALRKTHPGAVALLTGTMRGHERERLLTDPVFLRFDPESTTGARAGPAFLVCTSAGEVGVNLSADHLVCDPSTWDSLTQRFGRVNRFGVGDASIRVVVPKAPLGSSEIERRVQIATDLLRRLRALPNGDLDASPGALGSLCLEERVRGFAPEPEILPLTDVLIDAWSLTTPEDLPGRPPVAAWLHGRAAWEPATVAIAWRQEPTLFADLPRRRRDELARIVLDLYPLKPHELLRERADRGRKQLRLLAERTGDPEVWRLDGAGSLTVQRLSTIAAADDEDLRDNTLVLPAKVGGLSPEGLLDGRADAPESGLDVADQWAGGARIRAWAPADGWSQESAPADMRRVAELDLGANPDDAAADEVAPPQRVWTLWIRPELADDDGTDVAMRAQRLDYHLAEVRTHAARITRHLGLGPLSDAVVLAAALHDLGKDRAVWQRAIGNRDYDPRDRDRVLAKSGRAGPLRDLGGYRHELGSLHDLAGATAFHALDPMAQELCRHLIAAHHGRARPGFSTREGLDPGVGPLRSGQTAVEVLRLSERCQDRYGRWGLAWLEALVRAADALGSQSPDPEVRR